MTESNCSKCPARDTCGKAEEKIENINNVNNIKNKILVLSGKGGVGKSTVAANIAVSLSQEGYKTGLLDIDLHGPSIPRILSLEHKKTQLIDNLLIPVDYNEKLKVLSMGFFLEEDSTPLIWRGPVKQNIISQFINEVNWGDIDYLIVDCPPGTGDEPLSIVHALETLTGAVIVTTPQQLAVTDVKKSVNFCRQLEIPIIGIVENMSGYICPDCDKTIDIFKTGGGFKMAQEMEVPFLGRIPLDPKIVEACDNGEPFINFYNNSYTSKLFKEALKPVIQFDLKNTRLVNI